MAATTAPRRTQAERRLSARSAMITAAMQLLADGGYAGMTLGRIAKSAGVSETLTLHHFGSKADIFRAVIEDLYRRFDENEASKDLGTERLGRVRVVDWINDRFAEFASQSVRARAFIVIAIESTASAPDMGSVIHAHNQRVIDFISQAVRDGIADRSIQAETNAKQVAIAIVALVRGVGYEWFSDPALNLKERRQAILAAANQLLGPSGQPTSAVPRRRGVATREARNNRG